MKNTMSAVVAFTPRLRACAGPLRPPVEITVTGYDLATSTESSVEPSSTTMHSKSRKELRSRESRQVFKCCPQLYAGITTAIREFCMIWCQLRFHECSTLAL